MKLSHTITCAFAVAAACVCLPSVAADEEESEQAAQPAVDPALTEEIAYIEALVDANMPDFAAPVIAAAKKKWPNAGPKLKVLELQGDLRLGKFDAVQKVVDSLKGKKGQEGEYWALRLSMADAYYARGKMSECRKIYDEFFKTITKPGADLLDFYVESGFRWAQICAREKQYDEAVRMYGSLLAQPLPEDRWSSVAMEDVELLLRLAEEIPADPKDKQAKKRAEYLAQATKLVDKLLWKTDLILVFGKAIAMKAHIEMLRGNHEKAQGLVNDYMPQLSEIHRALMADDPDGSRGYVRASPMPECRYLLAKMLWDVAQAEAKKPKANEDLIKDSLFGARVGGKRNGLGAFNHAINVFMKYPESAWAADAGDMTEAITAFVKERYNKEIKTNITAVQLEKARKMRFQNAYDLYRGSEYEKAIAAYNDILSRAPESEETVTARGVLADCYVNLRMNAKKGSPEQAAYAKSAKEAEDFVASQFKGKGEALVREAGNQTLRLAAKEHDMGERVRSQELYDAYFANYPEHYNAAQMAYVLATQAFKNEDWEKAIRFFTILATQYPKSPHVASALQFLAICNEKKGDAAEQEKWLREYVKVEKKVGPRTTAQLSLALMQQKRGFAAFDAADETNDVAVAEAIRKDAYRGVAGAIRDFRGVAEDLTKALETEGKSLDAKERDLYLLRREQAIFLEAASWQRLTWPEAKVSAFRTQAVKAYEKYLSLYPKGQYAPQTLVKIGTIYTAEKNMEKAQDAFGRLQKDFPESDEAKNSLPRLAKTLIEMGLKTEGVAEYRKMLESSDGKYTAGQFLQAGNALLEAKSWQDAGDAYAKVAELAASLTNSAAYLAPALIGQASAAKGAKNYAEARQRLDEFIEKYSKSALVTNAYDMLVDVGIEIGRGEKDDALRMNAFNAAVGALKKLRAYSSSQIVAGKPDLKTQLELDKLDLRSCEVLLYKLQAELDPKVDRPEEAKKTRQRAVVAFTSFLMAHDPFTVTESGAKAFVRGKKEFNDMNPEQRKNLEYCYGRLLPLMVEQGLGKQNVEPYFDRYMELFGEEGFEGKKGDHFDEVESLRKQVKGK